MQKDVSGNTLALCDVEWDEPQEIAKMMYKLKGYTASEQFAKGIVEQPSHIQNLLICSRLRKVFGELSHIAGFDKRGNFIRTNWHDVIIPRWQDGRIESLDTFSTRQMEKAITG